VEFGLVLIPEPPHPVKTVIVAPAPTIISHNFRL